MASRIGCCIAVTALVCVLVGCGHEPRSGQMAAGHRMLQGTISTGDGAEDPRKRGIVLGKRGQEAGDSGAGKPAEAVSDGIEDDG